MDTSLIEYDKSLKMAKKFSFATYDRKHLKNLLRRAKDISSLLSDTAREGARIGEATGYTAPNGEFAFDKFPAVKQRVEELFKALHNQLLLTVTEGNREEWLLSAAKNDALVASRYSRAVKKLADRAEAWTEPHLEALEQFNKRKERGMNLSDRVWRLTDQFKSELELALEMGLGDGKSAAALSRDVREYLNEPHKLFRRVRNEKGQLRLSKAAAAYHPGQGVYRSSYKNALRLTATENNMAYRTADHERWNDLDFVIGIEIKLSNNHPVYDICDEMCGVYPKTFKFVGWHPFCRCIAVPKLANEDEFIARQQALIDGEELPQGGYAGEVTEMPQCFTNWVQENAERIETAKSTPYFVADNRASISRIIKGDKIEIETQTSQSKVIAPTPTSRPKEYEKNKTKTSDSESSALYSSVNSLEKAVERAKKYGIGSVDFSDASIDEINTILEVFHYAHQDYGINLNQIRLARDFNKKQHWAGSYNSDSKTLTLDLSGFKKSSYEETVSYADKIAKLQSNKASLMRQIEQSESRLGRSKASDRILKGDIKAMKSRMLDIDLKIQKYDKLIKDGYNELPLTVADTFKEIKEQMQARTWHEIGHHIDDRLGRPRFAEGNFISEYSKDMRGEEFAEWFSHYKMRGAKGVPADLLRIFREEEYKRYGERKCEQMYFDEKSSGYNVVHDLHQFSKRKSNGATLSGGDAEKWLGKQLAKQGKTIEFLPESGMNGKAGDMRFDGKVWDCKYIPSANVNTIRSYIKDARKADNVIFVFDELDRYDDIMKAVNCEIGRYKAERRNLGELPDVYIFDSQGRLKLVKK